MPRASPRLPGRRRRRRRIAAATLARILRELGARRRAGPRSPPRCPRSSRAWRRRPRPGRRSRPGTPTVDAPRSPPRTAAANALAGEAGHDAAQGPGPRRALHRARGRGRPRSSRPPRAPATATTRRLRRAPGHAAGGGRRRRPLARRRWPPARSRRLRDFLAARAEERKRRAEVRLPHRRRARIELLSQTISRAVEASLDDKERWRVYLFFYAAALLIGVGYLAARVIAAQAALREANESLEKRVEERTKELSDALVQLKESEAQLVQTEKMSSLGQMVAGVAHEINTPLAYVKNSVATVRDRLPELDDAVSQSERLMALLQSESPDPADLQEAFDAVNARLAQLREHQVLGDLESLTKDGLHGIEQISELVVNLKNFSRLDRSKVASFNVNEGVAATLLIAKPQLRNVDGRAALRRDPVDHLLALAGEPGAPEPRHQRRAGHRQARQAHRRHHAPRGRGRHRDRGGRQRQGHPARGAPEDLRPVLHHQGGRQGHRAGAVDRLQDRRSSTAAAST